MLASGARLQSYEIVSLLGSGGMGEVYRAIDTQLGRPVAIKVLPEALAFDAERVARLEREAKVLAALNHAHIASLYGFHAGGERPFLVMELVEGETLAERLTRKPLLPEEAIRLSIQIAEALEAAHEQGIIHRDLKPANIKLTRDDKVKVLDFGLARAIENTAPGAAPAITYSPTLSLMATQAGVILGTAAYMSPEQAKGAPADHRSDVFSFGCVLYEMLAGRQAFPGDSLTEVIASVIKIDPDFSLLPPGLHPRAGELIRRCLAKDPRRRWHAIADARVELESILADPRGTIVQPEPAVHRPLWRRMLPVLAGSLVAAAVSGAAVWVLRPVQTASPTRFSIFVPDDQRLTRTGRHNMALSPDGRNLVYVADRQMYLRRMGELDARAIPGTNLDINTPFFSPDSQWIAFYAVPESKLKKIALSGGASVTIADFAVNPFGASWTDDDQIVVGQGSLGISRVSANGGAPQTIVKPKPGEIFHGPQMLPDGDHVLFTVAREDGAQRWDRAQIVVQSISSGERKVLIQGGSDARYLPTGHLMYALGSNLLAVRFDASRREVLGGPINVVERVMRANAINTGAAFFSTSRDGVLAYLVGENPNAVVSRTITTVERDGRRRALPIVPGPFTDLRLSPDERQLLLAVDDEKGERDIWIYDVNGRVAPRRLTFNGTSASPVWAPDGQEVLYLSNHEANKPALYRQKANGREAPQRIGAPDAAQPAGDLSIAPDGSKVLFRDARGTGDIWFMPLRGEAVPKPLIEGPSNQFQPSFSPDGRWIAYASVESGEPRVYVQPFPPSGAKYEVSTTTARAPLWSADSRRLYFLEIESGNLTRVMSVDVETHAGFVFSNPTPVIEGVDRGGGAWPYAVMRDGRLLALLRGDAAEGTAAKPEIRVTLNWFEELKARVAGK
jgi:eukaryotic-like serine/threonine-protein kinase